LLTVIGDRQTKNRPPVLLKIEKIKTLNPVNMLTSSRENQLDIVNALKSIKMVNIKKDNTKKIAIIIIVINIFFIFKTITIYLSFFYLQIVYIQRYSKENKSISHILIMIC